MLLLLLLVLLLLEAEVEVVGAIVVRGRLPIVLGLVVEPSLLVGGLPLLEPRLKGGVFRSRSLTLALC